MIKTIVKGVVVMAFALSVVVMPFASGSADAQIAGETIQTCRWKRVVLRYGSANNCVKVVQAYLNEAKMLHAWKHYDVSQWPTLQVDGIYGNYTAWAVGVYQNTTNDPNYTYAADGIVHDRTWEVMQVQCLDRFSSSDWEWHVSKACFGTS